MFYNTTNETGEKIREYRKRTKTQDDFILNLIKASSVPLTASSILRIATIKGFEWPITSVRRTLTDLNKENKIRRAGKVMGPMGRNEFQYKP